MCKSWMSLSLKVLLSQQQVWTTGGSGLLGASRLFAHTGWPVIKELCLFSSAFTLGSTCCWGGCSTSYWIANLFLGGLFQLGGQTRVEKAIRHLRGAEDDKLEWGDGDTKMAWGGVGAARNVFSHRWMSGLAGTPASSFPSLRPRTYCFYLKADVTLSLNRSSGSTKWRGRGEKLNLPLTSRVV